MRYRIEMGWTDEVVWRRQPAHLVAGWARLQNTYRMKANVKGRAPISG